MKEYLVEVRMSHVYRGIIQAESQGQAAGMAGAQIDKLTVTAMRVETDALDLDADAEVDEKIIRHFQDAMSATKPFSYDDPKFQEAAARAVAMTHDPAEPTDSDIDPIATAEAREPTEADPDPVKARVRHLAKGRTEKWIPDDKTEAP